jgi:hypothetical protein
MVQISYIAVVSSCSLGLTGLFFCGLGLWGIVTRKPFLMSARWPYGLALLGLAPVLTLPFEDGTGDLRLLNWLNALLVICGFVFIWLTTGGYLAFGITDDSFREALLAALHKLGLPHEERVGCIRLPSIGADLKVAVQSGVGTAQLRVRQRQFGQLLRDIVEGMNDYYRTGAAPANLTWSRVCLFVGALMAVCAGVVLVMSRG